MKKIIISTLILIYINSFALAAEEDYLRVKVLEGINQIHISCFTPVEIRNTETQDVLLGKSSLTNFEIKPLSRGLSLGGVSVDAESVTIESPPLGIISLGKRQYRGRIECCRQSRNSLLIINELPVEGYLYGVLKHEISPKWPKESLKAQAIVARTFALYRLKKKSEEGYHLTDTVLSQVYAGFLSEDPVLTEVVDETRGMVLTYKGEVIPAYYHATCGGYTESPKYVWSEGQPYFQIHRCSYCKDSPHLYWKENLKLSRIAKNFRQKGYNFNRILDIKPTGKTPSGRLKKILIIHDKGSSIIKSNDFRLIMGPNIIRSTNFTTKKIDDVIKFKGIGWGHGVGLCQWGARGIALQGYEYDKILKFYYPGTKIEKLY